MEYIWVITMSQKTAAYVASLPPFARNWEGLACMGIQAFVLMHSVVLANSIVSEEVANYINCSQSAQVHFGVWDIKHKFTLATSLAISLRNWSYAKFQHTRYGVSNST